MMDDRDRPASTSSSAKDLEIARLQREITRLRTPAYELPRQNSAPSAPRTFVRNGYGALTSELSVSQIGAKQHLSQQQMERNAANRRSYEQAALSATRNTKGKRLTNSVACAGTVLKATTLVPNDKLFSNRYAQTQKRLERFASGARVQTPGELKRFDFDPPPVYEHFRRNVAPTLPGAPSARTARQAMIDAGITGPEGHPMSRPEATEAEATHRAIAMADQVNVPLYVVHVMSKSAAFEVERAKAAGVNVYGEPLAVALAVDGREQYNPDWRHAAGHVMSPPLREDPTTKLHLIEALKRGALDCVGTDNATFSANQKALGKDDFRKIPNGCNGIEDRMSVVWHKGVKGLDMSPSDFVRITSTKAAMLFNMYPRKGRVAEGCDADLVVWDGDAQRTVSKDTHHHAVDFNVFEGMTFYGVNDYTISGGRIVWEDGQLATENGWGRIVGREPFGYAYRDQMVSEHSKDPARRKVEREPYMGEVIQLP
eukprot:g6799.t1